MPKKRKRKNHNLDKRLQLSKSVSILFVVFIRLSVYNDTVRLCFKERTD